MQYFIDDAIIRPSLNTANPLKQGWHEYINDIYQWYISWYYHDIFKRKYHDIFDIFDIFKISTFIIIIYLLF